MRNIVGDERKGHLLVALFAVHVGTGSFIVYGEQGLAIVKAEAVVDVVVLEAGIGVGAGGARARGRLAVVVSSVADVRAIARDLGELVEGGGRLACRGWFCSPYLSRLRPASPIADYYISRPRGSFGNSAQKVGSLVERFEEDPDDQETVSFDRTVLCMYYKL